MAKTIGRWLLFRYIRGGEFTPLSKPFKTKQLAEKARSRYPERERKAIGIAETGKQELICPSLLLMPIDLSYPGCYHARKDKTLAEPPFPPAQREHTLFSVIHHVPTLAGRAASLARRRSLTDDDP